VIHLIAAVLGSEDHAGSGARRCAEAKRANVARVLEVRVLLIAARLILTVHVVDVPVEDRSFALERDRRAELVAPRGGAHREAIVLVDVGIVDLHGTGIEDEVVGKLLVAVGSQRAQA